MRVLLTGQVGLDKAAYLEAAREVCAQSGTILSTVSIGKLILQEAAGKYTEATILNAPKNELKALRANAWQAALAEADRTATGDIFVANSHAVLRWYHGPIPALELDTLLRFNPQILITLIDDVDLIKWGLNQRGTDIFQLWELMAWREEEIHITRLVSESLSRLTGKPVPFYLVPRKQGPELLTKLITSPNSRKAYLSFPVTGLGEEQKKEVERFKAEISSRLICFDPLALSERSIVSRALSIADETNAVVRPALEESLLADAEAGRAWEAMLDERTGLGLITMLSKDGRLLGREVLSIIDAIDSQIIARDYLLIEQADMIIAFIPVEDDGSGRISAGSQSEIVYAYQNGKEVYIVFPGDRRRLSPWVSEFAPSRVFATADECLAEFA